MTQEAERIIASALEVSTSGKMNPMQFSCYVDSLIKLLKACGVE